MYQRPVKDEAPHASASRHIFSISTSCDHHIVYHINMYRLMYMHALYIYTILHMHAMRCLCIHDNMRVIYIYIILYVCTF